MGTSTDAHCNSCEYEAFLLIGSGMQDFQTRYAWPVSCRKCAAITTANVKKLPLTCEECKHMDVIAMDDRRVWQGDGTVTERGYNVHLTNGHYRCPKCGKFQLRFKAGDIVQMWD